MSLMFFRVLPHTSVCIVSSNFITSILCLSCCRVSDDHSNNPSTHNLVNHHQRSGFGVLHAFHVAKDVGSVSLVKSIFNTATVGSTSNFQIRITRLEEEDVCASVACNEVNVIQDAWTDASARRIADQIRVNVDDRRTLWGKPWVEVLMYSK